MKDTQVALLFCLFLVKNFYIIPYRCPLVFRLSNQKRCFWIQPTTPSGQAFCKENFKCVHPEACRDKKCYEIAKQHFHEVYQNLINGSEKSNTPWGEYKRPEDVHNDLARRLRCLKEKTGCGFRPWHGSICQCAGPDLCDPCKIYFGQIEKDD